MTEHCRFSHDPLHQCMGNDGAPVRDGATCYFEAAAQLRAITREAATCFECGRSLTEPSCSRRAS